MNTKKLLNINEASKYLGVTRGSLYQMVHRRNIPYVKIGKSLRFDIEKLDQYISERSVKVLRYNRIQLKSFRAVRT